MWLRLYRGCRTDIMDKLVVEWYWESQPKRVRVPYAKPTEPGLYPEYHGAR